MYIYIKKNIFGGPGDHMSNPGVPKCHEDLITLETYVQGKTINIIISFHIYMYHDVKQVDQKGLESPAA